jgi:hypothetical protein
MQCLLKIIVNEKNIFLCFIDWLMLTFCSNLKYTVMKSPYTKVRFADTTNSVIFMEVRFP